MNFIDINNNDEIYWWSPAVGSPNQAGVSWAFFEFLKQYVGGINEGHPESHHIMVF